LIAIHKFANTLDLRKCEDRSCCKPPRAPDAFELLSLNNGFLPSVVQGRDKHFLSLLHILEYFRNQLPGYDEHCPSIPTELYREFVCQRCGKYFPTKAFMKKHVKAIHSNRKESVAQVIQEDSQSMISDKSHGIVEELIYNADQSIDDETATTSGVKNSMRINRQSTRGGNRRTEGGVKNLRPWKLRSSTASS
jgi:hypothetical protein